jgi:hypothetical protein
MILKEQLTELKAQLAETKILSIRNKLFWINKLIISIIAVERLGKQLTK